MGMGRDGMNGPPDITRMRRRRGESERDFWERKVAADPDVIVTDRRIGRQRPDESRAEYEERLRVAPPSDGRRVIVLRREGETSEEYSARLQAAAPPLSEEAKAEIRGASDEYWRTRIAKEWERRRTARHERRKRKRDRRKGDRRVSRLRVAFERRKGERRHDDRRELELPYEDHNGIGTHRIQWHSFPQPPRSTVGGIPLGVQY